MEYLRKGTSSKHTNEFQLLVETGLLEGTTGGDVCLATNPTPGNGHGGLDVPATQFTSISIRRHQSRLHFLVQTKVDIDKENRIEYFNYAHYFF